MKRSKTKPVKKPGCEFCRQSFNRPAESYTCPYCGKAWRKRAVRKKS